MVIQHEVERINHLVVELKCFRFERPALGRCVIGEIQLAVHHAPVEPYAFGRYHRAVLKRHVIRVVKVLEQRVSRNALMALQCRLEGVRALDRAFIVIAEPVQDLGPIKPEIVTGRRVIYITAVGIRSVSRRKSRNELAGIVVHRNEVSAKAAHVGRDRAVFIKREMDEVEGRHLGRALDVIDDDLFPVVDRNAVPVGIKDVFAILVLLVALQYWVGTDVAAGRVNTTNLVVG